MCSLYALQELYQKLLCILTFSVNNVRKSGFSFNGICVIVVCVKLLTLFGCCQSVFFAELVPVALVFLLGCFVMSLISQIIMQVKKTVFKCAVIDVAVAVALNQP